MKELLQPAAAESGAPQTGRRCTGQSRISRQISSVRWFSIIITTMPWSSPKWPAETQARPSAPAKLGLKLLA